MALNALELYKSEREKRKNRRSCQGVEACPTIAILCRAAKASLSQEMEQEKQSRRKRARETFGVTADVSNDDCQPVLKKARTTVKTAHTANTELSSTRPAKAGVPAAAVKSAATSKTDIQAPSTGPTTSTDEALEIERRREVILTEMTKLESLYKKREDDLRVAMKEEYEVREDTLRAELESLYKKCEADALTASARRFDSVRAETEKQHKQREDALRVQFVSGFKRWAVQARIACEKHVWDMAKEHEQREATLRAELDSRSQAEVEEHKRHEADLRLELESLYQKRRAEDEHFSAVERKKEMARLRDELESKYKREAERCVELEAELAVEKAKQMEMHRRIEILLDSEENAVLTAEKELSERKARLAALRGNGVQ
ncbi:hypothetical protein BDZ89DRAFT_1163075 [Hymenopellis radicata]|nr:hypothetical protein BDZ89DRAFT_1163075 [Hymenopellis radicata]